MAIRIFVDQGHNPSNINAGAVGHGLVEQDVTYMVGTYLSYILDADDRFEVRVSRTTPTEVLGYDNTSSLRIRVDMANSWPADYFISIHGNANVNPAINGTEGYVYAANTEAYYLAQDIVTEISRRVGTVDKGVFVNPSLYVLRNTTMPSVLVELAYLSNYEDAIKLANDQYQFAYGIYVGMLNYFGLPQI